MSQQRRWPFLDGLRALAVLGVIGFHLELRDVLPGGYAGVDVFFTISGFLITYLLLTELDRTGRVDRRAFYLRRALRLLPALWAMFLVVTAAIVLFRELHGWAYQLVRVIPWTVIYATNWPIALHFDEGNGVTFGFFAHTWSLAVEEQFYLVWPFLLVALVRLVTDRRRATCVLLAAAFGELGYSEWATTAWGIGRAYDGTDTRCFGLLLGATLACWFTSTAWRPPRGRALMAWGGLVTVVVVAVTCRTTTVGIPLASIATMSLIWALIPGRTPGVSALLESAPAQWIGKRSYGLYLWHYPLDIALYSYGLHGSVDVLPLQLGLPFLIAAVSYRFLEQPFVRLKSQYERAAAGNSAILDPSLVLGGDMASRPR